jgi:hypothetical protein
MDRAGVKGPVIFWNCGLRPAVLEDRQLKRRPPACGPWGPANEIAASGLRSLRTGVRNYRPPAPKGRGGKTHRPGSLASGLRHPFSKICDLASWFKKNAELYFILQVPATAWCPWLLVNQVYQLQNIEPQTRFETPQTLWTPVTWSQLIVWFPTINLSLVGHNLVSKKFHFNLGHRIVLEVQNIILQLPSNQCLESTNNTNIVKVEDDGFRKIR